MLDKICNVKIFECFWTIPKRKQRLSQIAIYFLVISIFIGILFWSKPLLQKWSETKTVQTNHSECDENMSYNISYMHNNIHYIAKGKEFPCKSLKYLKKFKLSDQFPILNISKVGKFPEDVVFLFASDVKFYPSLRAAIASTQITFNYSYKKIIVYDLGGLAESPEIMSELKGVCKLELRIFDKHQLPFSVRHLSSFAWKVFLIAEVFVEHELFIYFDTSVYFFESDYDDYFSLMESGQLFNLQFTRNTMHGIRFATHPSLLNYLPLHPLFKSDIEMHEANMIIFRKSEYTRQILKWALLCATEKECIQPTGSIFECFVHDEGLIPDGTCNRLDQSAFSILISNAEKVAMDQGNNRLIPHRSFYHPSRLRDRHILLRSKTTATKIDTCKNGQPKKRRVTRSEEQTALFKLVSNVCRNYYLADHMDLGLE